MDDTRYALRAGDAWVLVRLVAGIVAMVLGSAGIAAAQERAEKSYLIPALEIPAFVFGLNAFDRAVFDSKDYDTDFDSIGRNLRTAPALDRDPFSVNQLGHPYQGSIYYGAARSAGLSYWESLLYTLGGSYLWETVGETTRPSINDHVATGIGGTFVGEALFRMSSLLLEGEGATPGFWRELAAALISPPTGFNRLVFGERFDAIFPSRDPAVFVRLRLGWTLASDVNNEAPSAREHAHEGTVDFSMVYGLPGKPGYRYTRPFDYFHFNLTIVPNATSLANAVENVTIQGMLVGRAYEAGEHYRGVWGLFGGFDYLSPQIFRLSTTNTSLGTVGHWSPSPRIAVQGAALAGIGFGAAGNVADREERDYHYGVIPQAILAVRLLFGEIAMLEAIGRRYYVVGTGGGAREERDAGLDVVSRATVAITARVTGPHAVSLQYAVTARDASFPERRDQHQSVQTLGLYYTLLGRGGFGAVHRER